MNTTLCIIDVQPRFDAAINVVDQVVHQVRMARRRHDGIILLEYGTKCPSYKKIYATLHNYGLFSVVYKHQNGGSEEIINQVRTKKYSMDRIRVCGVNGCACVEETTCGLLKSKIFNRVEVAMDAIGCICVNDSKCWKLWSFRDSITLR